MAKPGRWAYRRCHHCSGGGGGDDDLRCQARFEDLPRGQWGGVTRAPECVQMMGRLFCAGGKSYLSSAEFAQSVAAANKMMQPAQSMSRSDTWPVD